MHVTPEIRLAECNEVIRIIGSHGRKFFKQKSAFAFFSRDERGRIWFTDDYTGKKIYTHHNGRWKGFSHGGTMRGLIDAMRKYIVRGDTSVWFHFGPWPKTCCNGDPWGYGSEMEDVRIKALQIFIRGDFAKQLIASQKHKNASRGKDVIRADEMEGADLGEGGESPQT